MTTLILIGGTAGVGKTTIARAVAHRLGGAHHVATGFLRETLRAYLPKEVVSRTLSLHLPA